ncbi:CD2-binding protein-like protein [Wolffia australiana]
MAEGGKVAGRKRPLQVEDYIYEEETLATERKVRFPKGKKVKKANEASGSGNGDEVGCLTNPELAVRERAHRRSQNREDELFKAKVAGEDDVAAAEVHYEVHTSFDDDGISLEPFNLKQEREEGYFDADGNYVEYVARKEIKDAWLDNLEVDPKLAEKVLQRPSKEEFDDLSSDDIGKIKRRIANALQPGETVLNALKRLKGPTGGRKNKMPEQVKLAFDQLTEDAMKLMEGGEFDVYYEKKETFEREAEGYERLVLAREGTSQNSGDIYSTTMIGSDIFTDAPMEETLSSSQILPSTGQSNGITEKTQANDDDTFDMFGDEEAETTNKPVSESLKAPDDAGEGRTADYVFDESSGYYYSSSLGYFYDPSSQLYCCASSGKWYSFDEESGVYNEVQADPQNQA